MADNETITDIIAWLRRPREGENAYLTLWRDEIADRLEAAHKRELSKNVSKNGADFGQLGDCAKLREAIDYLCERMADMDATFDPSEVECLRAALSAPPRNCDAHTADPDWKDICAKCKDGDIEPKHCEYYGEPNRCNSPIYGVHPTIKKSLVVGNAAKLREALKKCILYIACAKSVGTGVITLNDKVKLDPKKIIKSAKAALAAPPRNCDRYASAEGAWDAYDKWVDSYRAQGKTEPCNEFGWLFATRRRRKESRSEGGV